MNKEYDSKKNGQKRYTGNKKFEKKPAENKPENKKAEKPKNKYWKPVEERKPREQKEDKKSFQGRNTKPVKGKYSVKASGKAESRPSVKPSKNSLCKVSGKCGSCQLLDIPYEQQLKDKHKQVKKLLEQYCPVEPVVGMEDPFHYRNKVHAAFGHLKDGTVITGNYQEGTHYIVAIDNCLIDDQRADDIIRDIRKLVQSFKIKTYNEDTGYGLMRHVLIRTCHSTGQIMVVLVLGSRIMPSKRNFTKALLKLHPEITTVVLNINDKPTSMILGEKEEVLYGKGYVEDVLCGKTFRISSKSFYQINSLQTEKLYAKAIEMAQLTGKERVLDSYCGIGTIGLSACDHAAEVIGVELNKDAVKDAVINAKRNDAQHVRFYCDDAGAFMVKMAEENEKLDVLFMDPPRSGSTEEFMEAAVKIAPDRIVYISCNPETQARDLKYLTKHGYKAEKAVPVDMFPFTGHVECIVSLSKTRK